MHRISTRAPHDRVAPPMVDSTAETLSGFLEDAAHFPGGHAVGIAFPRSEDEVAALVRAHRTVLPIGAQSSLTGGATPAGELLISLAHMNRVREIGDHVVRVEPGASLTRLQEELDAHDLYYPPAPTFTGATLGGTVATNAAGAVTFKYGSTRAWVEALTVVLSSGELLDVKRGQVCAHPDGFFEIEMAERTVRVPVPRYRMPTVAKRSAGYHAEPGMDLVDLFVGSEGTLGIVTEATLRAVRRAFAPCVAFVPLASEAAALALTALLRDAAQAAWQGGNDGLDVPAIEYVDGRSLSLVPNRLFVRAGVPWDLGRRAALFVQVELPAGTTAREAFDQIGSFKENPSTPLGRFCRLLAEFHVLDAAEIALPGDRRRAAQIVELREAVPAAVNDLVGLAKRSVDHTIEKVAGDVVVPFEQLGAMLQHARAAFESRKLEYAIWGHASDGNLHPNLLPRSTEEVRAGKEAILELGQRVAELGGCPLAEHGVGRNAVKQALLRQLYGESGIEEMRAVKRALDPEWKLAPGVIFPRESPIKNSP